MAELESLFPFLSLLQGAARSALFRESFRQWTGVSQNVLNEGQPYLRSLQNDIRFTGDTGQWHLFNKIGLTIGPDINVEGAWQDYHGEGVRVVVGDDGVDYTHPELSANYDLNADYDIFHKIGDAKPRYTTFPFDYDLHGTFVAGLISAANNGTGTTGVAYGAKLSGIRLIGDTDPFTGVSEYSLLTATDQYDAIKREAQFDVANNSWGFDAFTITDTGLNWDNALQFVAQTGRGGLGTALVFAGGNYGDLGEDNNYSELSNSRFVINVAAVDRQGAATSFTTPGADIMVSAPGQGIYSIQPNGVIFDPNSPDPNLQAGEAGTSFSSPIVAGVVALMLQANKNLGYRDIQEILAYSSRLNDPTDPSWHNNGANNANGGGLHFNEYLGFGMVDATAAVRLAETWSYTHPQAGTLANEKKFTFAGGNMTAFDGAMKSSTVTVGAGALQGPFQVEHAEVKLDLVSNHIGDLLIKLISPTGMVSNVFFEPSEATQYPQYANNPTVPGKPFDPLHPDTTSAPDATPGSNASSYYSGWSFSTVGQWGESGIGDWKLEVYDGLDLLAPGTTFASNGFTTTLNSWTLTLYGDSVTNDDTYYYNDDFSTYTSNSLADTNRRTLSDTNGGIDTLNFSAITRNDGFYAGLNLNLTVDLTQGVTSSVVGNTLTIANGSDIENAIGGDGNDTFTGNALNNRIWGGRGTDTIVGGLGDDTLIGDQGNDSLSGDQGNDSLFGGIGNDILAGGIGADTLDGGLGNDSMAGGIGDDTYFVDNTSDVITELAGEGTDTVFAAANYTLSGNLENLTITGTAGFSGTGDSGNNLITGNSAGNSLKGMAGDDTLDGGLGIDIMVGGLGDDLYIVDRTSDVITELAGEGIDTVRATFTYTLGANIENLILLGTGNFVGTGNALDNQITGNSGNNSLNGGAGNDALDGGLGNDTLDGGIGIGVDSLTGGQGDDTYNVDSSDFIIELAGEGIDSVFSSSSFLLAPFANVENLTFLGIADADGSGNGLNNKILGNSGRNSLTGGAGDDSLDGGAGNDTLEGDDGNDTLVGGLGNDSMAGGLGNDTYVVDSTFDVVTELAGEGIDTITTTFNFTLLGNIENLILQQGSAALIGIGDNVDNHITGNSGNNSLSGDLGSDTLEGGLGNDTLDGGLGTDTMDGGAGNDTYSVDDLLDVVVDSAGLDTVNYSVNFGMTVDLATAFGGAIEIFKILSGAVINVLGNGAANNIVGNGANNNLTGLAGNDTLNGGLGDDILDGGIGTDSLIGGLGDDTYLIDTLSDIISELAGQGTDTVQAAFSYTLGATLENLTLLGTGNFTGTGNAANNLIIGNSGNNTLDGGLGTDTLQGGLGDDFYKVKTGDTITENAGEGFDTVQSGTTYVLGAELEKLILTGTGNINGTGNALNNEIVGNAGANSLDGGAGDDTLNGGAGNDTMVGGLGDDTYFVDNASDVVTENAGEGTDTIFTTFSFALGGNIENLTLLGTAANGTGDTGNNRITGNVSANKLAGDLGDDTMDGGLGNDTLDGGLGADIMDGGGGNDLYLVDDLGDVITESSATGGIDTVRSSVTFSLATGFVDNLILLGGNANLDGTGNALNNQIIGNDGDNVLDGGAGPGADTLVGGLGDDTYVVHSKLDVVTELAGQGTDTVQSFVDYTLGANIEKLKLMGGGNVSVKGNAANNDITGNAGDNTLDGGLGADTMRGGLGNDFYIVDNPGDSIIENAAEGNDTVQISTTFDLSSIANIENVVLSGTSSINAIGNSLDNRMTGNAGKNMLTGNDGNDTLDGGAGIDTMIGGLGNDTYFVDNALDVVTELAGEGNDTVFSTFNFTLGGNIENLVLLGSAITGTGDAGDNSITGNTMNNILNGGLGADTMNGGLGNDTLDGGLGADVLDGGAGNDTYFLDDINDVVSDSAGLVDTINYNVNVGGNINLVTDFGGGIEVFKILSGAAINVAGNDGANNIVGNAANNNLSGGLGNDTLDGGAGDDTLDGGLGNDKMVGGLGNDSYVVDSTLDVVTELANAGTDTVSASINYTLGSYLENLTLTGTAHTGYGNGLNNILTGTNTDNWLFGQGGNDTINGGQGNDGLYGGVGNDTYFIALGDGRDQVADLDYALGNKDTIEFTDPGITSGNVAFFKDSSGNLQIGYVGNNTDQITVARYFTNGYAVEEFKLDGEGKFMTNTDVNQVIQNMANYAKTNNIALTSIDVVKNDANLMNIVTAGWHV